jgi:hypothetical protein
LYQAAKDFGDVVLRSLKFGLLPKFVFGALLSMEASWLAGNKTWAKDVFAVSEILNKSPAISAVCFIKL